MESIQTKVAIQTKLNKNSPEKGFFQHSEESLNIFLKYFVSEHFIYNIIKNSNKKPYQKAP